VPNDIKHAREQVYKADALLFGVPEYNFTVSSPLKNAYDWLSREYKTGETWNKRAPKSPVEEKVGAMVSVGGPQGGAKAQNHFLECVELRKLKILPPSGKN
jgi:NAD(P)H-dependent FMN reductase